MTIRTKFDLNRELSQRGIKGRSWGASGKDGRVRLEKRLGFSLDRELGEFAQGVGNALIGPFGILLTGKEGTMHDAAFETEQLFGKTRNQKLVKIMDHAGESYIYDVDGHTVGVFDSGDLSSPTLTFESLDSFLTWLFDRAVEHAENAPRQFPID